MFPGFWEKMDDIIFIYKQKIRTQISPVVFSGTILDLEMVTEDASIDSVENLRDRYL